ncbi:MAG: zinc-dependent alcohol dehydrogenase [Candidatus Thorarchaeota archaeon]
MKSLILTPDGLQLGNTPMPSLMPGETRIEVRAVGLCKSDLAIWQGEMEADLPLILGHEISGFVHESTDPSLRPGTPVTTEIFRFCERCYYCRHGMRQYCVDRRILGMTTDGGLAEYVSVSTDMIHVLPEGVDAIAGTFTEPLASAIATVQAAPARKDEIVAIIGSGRLGLLTAQVYDAAGAEVYLIGKNHWKLGLARQLGLRHVIDNSQADWKRKILDNTEGAGPRLVVDVTGTPEGLKTALQVVRDGGTLALKSVIGVNGGIAPSMIVNRGLKIVGSLGGPFDTALDMLAKGRIEVKRLVTKQFVIDEGIAAFEYAIKPEAIKVIINI